MLKHLVRGRQCLWFSGKDEDDLKVLADSQSCLSLMRQFPNIIIDEAQFFPDIGRVIKEMVENTTTDSRIFVIGSSKLAFGVPLGQSGGDRIDSFTLWPLALEERARRNGWDDVKRDIYDRMIYGCYPTVINDPAHAREFLIDMADTLLHRDLFQLAEVRKKMDLERLLAVLAAKVGSVIHYGAIARELGIENKTIERYVELLAACFIVRVVPSWYGQSSAELRLSKKIYFYDNGVRNALLRDFTPVPARKDKEVLWENLFFTERLKRHAVRRDGGEIYFWRTKKGHEMDFVEVVNGTIVAFACRAANLTALPSNPPSKPSCAPTRTSPSRLQRPRRSIGNRKTLCVSRPPSRRRAMFRVKLSGQADPSWVRSSFAKSLTGARAVYSKVEGGVQRARGNDSDFL